MEKFVFGVALGMLGGALLVTNNYKMRMLVKKSQEEVQTKLNDMLDEKVQAMEEKAEEVTEKVKDGVSSAVEEVKGKVKKVSKK